MNKKVLIISPYFAPSNTADMQRVRMSLPYFKDFGWDAEVVTVDPAYSDLQKDELLLESIPADVKIHQVKALNKAWTSRLGLGSLALRSLCYYKKKVDALLAETHYDLIYFSTTHFAVCILGPHWGKKFGIRYVIDMQDPWHSDYYRDKSKDQQPPKYWFSYRMNKYLEPIAMKSVSGLISVSGRYIKDLKNRYPIIKDLPAAIIPFGAFEQDLVIAQEHITQFTPLLDTSFINIVYIGRGGKDMHRAIVPLFNALQKGLQSDREKFRKIKLNFIGTSYAPNSQGKPTILPLAQEFDVQDCITEITDRISYFHALSTLQQADVLFVPGSDSPGYTASKIYPYLLTRKPILAVFDPLSPVLSILDEYGAKYGFNYSDNSIVQQIFAFLTELTGGTVGEQTYNNMALRKYSAKNMTREQCHLFDNVINNN